MYEPKYYSSTNMKKTLDVSHMMESFYFVVNIYGRWSYLLYPSVLSKKSPSL